MKNSNQIESIKKNMVTMLAKIAHKYTDEPNAAGWPPVCSAIFYQSKRPQCLHSGNKRK